VLTIDEIKSVPLFSTLGQAELSLLAQTAADIQLTPGEYAVHEGGEPALFAVLAGKMEVVKVVNGELRVLGYRLPGTIFGEVPIALGTPFPGAYRAVEPSRVMRVARQHYYAIAAASSDVSTKVGALARERMGGLQNIFKETPKTRVTVVGGRFDPACSELRRFLERNQIAFNWLTPDLPEAKAILQENKLTEDRCPLVRYEDDRTVCARPTVLDLALHLKLQTQPRSREYDVVIIGGGPAGLAAAVYGASEGLSTLVVEREAPGGQAGTSSRIENYLGFPGGVSGDELANRALTQARRLGAEIVVTRSVARVDSQSREVFFNDLESGIHARTVIFATGVSWRRLEIEGIDRLIGKGVYYGAARSETPVAQGLDVFLVGAGNSAGQAAMHFAAHARSVTLVVRGESLEKSMSRYLIDQLHGRSNIKALLNSEVSAVHGETQLTAIDIRDRRTSQTQRYSSGGLFAFIGAVAETSWLPSDVARDRNGYILTGNELLRANRWSVTNRDPYLLETSVPGMFACGDVRLGSVKRVAAAVGEGSMAIALVHQYLSTLAPVTR
jgi:thioredoxin reductase (NADPH)